MKTKILQGICFSMVLISLPGLTFSEESDKKKTPLDQPAPKVDRVSPFQKALQGKAIKAPAKIAPEKSAQVDVEKTTEEEKSKLLPVPNKAAIAEAMALVRDLFQDEFKDAKTATKKSELAKKILKSGIETEGDAGGRFVLLRLARDIAAGANDLETALKAIDQLEESFDVDALSMRVKVLEQISPKSRDLKLRKLVFDTSMGLIDEAIEQEKLDAAETFQKLAMAYAKSTHKPELIKRVNARRNEIADLAKEFFVVKTARATLEVNPTDPAANLTVGKFFCFIRDDWEKGLPMLALGADASLKAMAVAEQASPTDSAEQLKLGNDWWNMAESTTGTHKKNLQWRAGHWYENALPELKGLTKTITEKRLAKIPERPASSSKGVLKSFFLDDMPETSSVVYSSRLGKHGNYGWKSSKGKVNGREYRHALSVHPTERESSSVVTYALGGRFISLNVVAALWDSANPKSPMTFKVIGDNNKVLWQAKPMQKAGQWQQCKVSLKGVKTLKLQVDCTNYYYGHAVWINPQIIGRVAPLPKNFKGLQPGLVAEYYEGTNFEKILQAKVDRGVNVKWDRRPPATPRPTAKPFSVRWTGWIKAPQPGTYQMRVVSDDGVRIWLDDNVVVDSWKGQSGGGHNFQAILSSKPHKLKVEYFDQGYNAYIYLFWASGSGKEPQRVPPQAYYHSSADLKQAQESTKVKVVSASEAQKRVNIAAAAAEATKQLPRLLSEQKDQLRRVDYAAKPMKEYEGRILELRRSLARTKDREDYQETMRDIQRYMGRYNEARNKALLEQRKLFQIKKQVAEAEKKIAEGKKLNQ